MTATTLDVSPSPDEFAARSADTVASRYQHLDHRRRVRVGSAVSVVFEDRHTLWFRIQELNRIARRSPSEAVRRQLAWYQRLMPGDGRLVAAVWVAARGADTPKIRSAVAAGRVLLRSDAGHEVIGRFLSEQSADRTLGMVRWVEFRFPAVAQAALHEPTVGWHLEIEADGLTLPAARLGEPVLQSLSADLG
jgi:hypothetical protein